MEKSPKVYDSHKAYSFKMCKSDNVQEENGKHGRILKKVARFLTDFSGKKNKI